VEQELLILPEHPSSTSVFSGIRVTRSLVLCVCVLDSWLFFVLFLLANVLFVLLRFTNSDYPFGIFQLFLLSKYSLYTYNCFSVQDIVCFLYFKGQVNSKHVPSDLRNLTVEVKSNIKYTFAVSIKQIQNDIIIIHTDEFRIKKTHHDHEDHYLLVKG